MTRLLLCCSLALIGCAANPLPNPAAANCATHDAGWLALETSAGEGGVCAFSDGSQCEAWAFYRGECQPGDCFSWTAAGCLHPRGSCQAGTLKARTDAGDTELCTVPLVDCLGTELISQSQCHYPPSPSPAQACCAPRPAACAPSDCDCLLRNGPWIDDELARDAGTTLVDYDGGRARCSYRVSCTPGGDGGLPVLSCTPA